MTDDNIDYDKLSTMVADKLHTGIVASLQGKAALDEQWFNEYLFNWVKNHPAFLAQYVFSSYEFDTAFKTKLKSVINNIY